MLWLPVKSTRPSRGTFSVPSETGLSRRFSGWIRRSRVSINEGSNSMLSSRTVMLTLRGFTIDGNTLFAGIQVLAEHQSTSCR